MTVIRTTIGFTSLIAGIIGLSACGAITEERTYTADGDVSSVKIRLTNGDLNVVTSPTDEVEINVDFAGLAIADEVSRYVEDGELIINYSCPLCGGDLLVEVPEGMPVNADLINGDLFLADLSGEVNANVENGGIEGLNLSGKTHASTRAGTITLDYSVRPELVLAETTLGVIDIYVPNGRYNLEFGGNIGTVNLTDIVDDDSASSKLSLFTDTGEINITGQTINLPDDPSER